MNLGREKNCPSNTNPHGMVTHILPCDYPTNFSQSDTLQIKSHILVKQTEWCYILGSPKPLMGKPSETPTHHPLKPLLCNLVHSTFLHRDCHCPRTLHPQFWITGNNPSKAPELPRRVRSRCPAWNPWKRRVDRNTDECTINGWGVLGAVCGAKQPCHQQHRSHAQL